MGEIYAKGKVCIERTKFESRSRRKREENTEDEDGEAEEDIRQDALGLFSRDTELSNRLLRILVIITSG